MKKLLLVGAFALTAFGVSAEPAFAKTQTTYKVAKKKTVAQAPKRKVQAYVQPAKRYTTAQARKAPKMAQARKTTWTKPMAANNGRGGYATANNHRVNRSHTNVAVVPPHVEDWQVDGSVGHGGYYGNTAGKVAVNWVPRGGTCNIRYTEEHEQYYKYRTSAGCDEVHHVVRSLEAGQNYKFQVAKDSWNDWSGTAIAQAW